MFDGKLVEEDWVRIHGFKIKTFKGNKKASENDFEIFFLPSTIVHPLSPRPSDSWISPKDFDAIYKRSVKEEFLVGKYLYSISQYMCDLLMN